MHFMISQIPKEKYELDAKVNEQLRVNRLVHNLTSINAPVIFKKYMILFHERFFQQIIRNKLIV